MFSVENDSRVATLVDQRASVQRLESSSIRLLSSASISKHPCLRARGTTE